MMTPRKSYALAAMLSGNSDHELTPVQAQKLFFLLDKNASHLVGGPHFDFEPYDYGPFDRGVYSDLEELAHEFGYVKIARDGRYRTYRLTEAGAAAAKGYAVQFPSAAVQYMGEVKDWVKSLPFRELVSSIYRAYPEMRQNSIFRE